MMSTSGVLRSEAYGRVTAVLILVLTAVLIGTNRETKVLFQVLTKTATFRSIDVFVLQLYAVVLVAAYNLIQLIRCIISFSGNEQRLTNKSTAAGLFISQLVVPWLTFLIDQMAVYLVLGTNCASMAGSLFAVTGNRAMQWEKLCNIYNRFCAQVGGYLFCGFVASIVLACLSCISAYSLFRLYSPSHFLTLKNKNNMIKHTANESTPSMMNL